MEGQLATVASYGRTARATRSTLVYLVSPGKHRAMQDHSRSLRLIGWHNCLQDVLPVLTGMNVLFQSSLPLPHLLYSKITAAKATLMNMVGTGATRTALINIDEINVNTSFGAFANKFIRENREGSLLRNHGSSLRDDDVMQLKRGWHKFYAHCLREIDARFPPENMLMFRLMQVLDPSTVHGPTRRNLIGGADLSEAVLELLLLFELPCHGI